MRTISIKLIGDETPIKLYIDEFGESVLENDMISEDMNFVRILTNRKTGEKDRKIFFNKSTIESIVIQEVKEE